MEVYYYLLYLIIFFSMFCLWWIINWVNETRVAKYLKNKMSSSGDKKMSKEQFINYAKGSAISDHEYEKRIVTSEVKDEPVAVNEFPTKDDHKLYVKYLEEGGQMTLMDWFRKNKKILRSDNIKNRNHKRNEKLGIKLEINE